jgi:hypothetical protein
VDLPDRVVQRASHNRRSRVAGLAETVPGLIHRRCRIDGHDPVARHQNLAQRTAGDLDGPGHDLALRFGKGWLGLDEVNDFGFGDLISVAVRVAPGGSDQDVCQLAQHEDDGSGSGNET